jgi:Na+-transporting methylmalonyl-CoA/oxaloacetate decarboxylase gamma subunit|tara:strand:+ start:16 stop:486 length:471 start_codon:yes stop_codon:yes gene_type:complete
MNNGFGQLIAFLLLLVLAVGGPIYLKDQKAQKEQEDRATQEALKAEEAKLQAIEDAIIKHTIEHDEDPETASMPIELKGSGFDNDGDELTYKWEQTGGNDVTIADAEAASTSFEAGPGEYSFQLTVTDPYDATSSTQQTYRISEEPNSGPEANISE